jgi:glycosyltransferase involved in cell wall biosynthesis
LRASRPRALFICPTLTVGGAERQWATLIPSLRDRGFTSLVTTLNHRGHFFDVLSSTDGVETRAIDMRSRFDVRGAIRAIRLSAWLPDVVVTQSIDAHVLGHLVAMKASVPHVAVEHGGPGLARRRHHAPLYRWVAPRTDSIVAVSESQISDLLALGYQRSRIDVIPNGIDPPHVALDRVAARTLARADGDDFLAVFVATLRPEKRVERFIEAVASAHRGDSRIRGLVVGGGPELARAQTLAGETPAVEVIGYREDIGSFVAAANVVCLTSDVEANPISLLEAMALGIPVVATDVGGVREVVEDEAGILVPAGDVAATAAALRDLAANPERATTLGAAGLRRYQDRYTAGTMSGAYADLLRQVMVRGRR